MTHFAESRLRPYPVRSLEETPVWSVIDPDAAYDRLDQTGDMSPDEIRGELGIQLETIAPETVALAAVAELSDVRNAKAIVLAARKRTAARVA